MADWDTCLLRGKIKENIVKTDFLDYLCIGYIDISEQRKEVDLQVNELKSIDIKSYCDNGTIPIEEVSVMDKDNQVITKGWFYSSGAKYFIYVSSNTRTMLILKNDQKLHDWYEDNKERFNLKTQPNWRDGQLSWYSQHRSIPLEELNIAWYKKNRSINKLKLT